MKLVKVIFGAAILHVILAAGLTAQATQFRAITIVSEPSANVWVDGVGWGKTDSKGRLEIKTVSPGPHSIRLRASGFKDKTQTLTAVQKGEIAIALVKTTDEAELAYQEGERLAFSDREKSAEAFRKAVRLRPNFPEAYVSLARVLTELEDTEEAMKAIVTAKRLRVNYAEASAVEGRIHKENGDEDKAIAAFKRSITEGKGFQPEAYAGLGLFYKERAEAAGASGDYENEDLNFAEASKNLKMSLKQLSGAPDTVVIYQLLGLLYERQKKYKEAIATYEEFLRIFPTSNEATAVRSFIVQLKKDMASQEQ